MNPPLRLRRALTTVLTALACLGSAEAAPLPLWRIPAVVDAVAGHGGRTLDDLVSACRRTFPQATVTSGFLDWRRVSRYRRTPGLHLGYDVAMPAGTPVQCAWPGRVVALTPWTDTEWGVTVRHADGSEATYGHLSKTVVAAGVEVSAGHPLGFVAVDHVDVKMRDANGRPLDFGAVASAPSDAASAWIRARFAAAEAEARLSTLRRRATLLERLTMSGDDGAESDAMRVRAGLISVKEAARRDAMRDTARRKRQAMQREQAQVREEMRDAAADVASASSHLRSVERQAQRDGLTWADVEQRIARLLSRDVTLRNKAAQARAAAVDRPDTSAEVRSADLARYNALYRAGVISRRGYEHATGRRAPASAILMAD